MAKRLATLDDVKKLAPDLADKIDTDTEFANLVQCYLDLYSESFDPDDWCIKTSFGHVWLALHWLTKHGQIDDPGDGLVAQSESFGRISVSYSQVTHDPTHGDFSSTSYGQRYADLRGRVFVRGIRYARPLDYC